MGHGSAINEVKTHTVDDGLVLSASKDERYADCFLFLILSSMMYMMFPRTYFSFHSIYLFVNCNSETANNSIYSCFKTVYNFKTILKFRFNVW